MIIVQSTDVIDIVKLEEIKKWCEYKPDNFIKNQSFKNKELLKKDNLILSYLKLLYKLLKISDNDKNNHNFKIGEILFDKYKEYKDTLNMIYTLFNINEEAELKLSPIKIKECIGFTQNLTINTIDNINEISNFFVKNYTEYLILNDPQISLIKGIRERETKLNKKLSRVKFHSIRMTRKPHKYK